MAGRFRSGTALWLASAAGLSGVIALEINNELPLASSVEAALAEASPGESDDADQAVVSLPSSDLIDDIVARPLLSKSRRPFVRTMEETLGIVETSDRMPDLELIGTMLTGDARVALLKRAGGGLIRVRHGQDIGGWQIKDITHREVRLENGEDVQVLTLRKDLMKPRQPRKPSPETTAAARKGSSAPQPPQPSAEPETQ